MSAKYLVLLAADESVWATLGGEERQRVMNAHDAFHRAVTEQATMVAGEALAGSGEGRTLRHVDDQPAVTEGPFAEGVEQLGGFYLIEAESIDLLLDLSRLLPSWYAVEVRPVIAIEGYEDTRDWQ